MKGSGNSAFLQKDHLCYLKRAEKEQKKQRLKKGTFLEKKGGFFKLSDENILTSILSAFHPFLTLPNKTLKREKGTFFQFEAISSKARKRYLFCGLETFLSKEQKRYLFCGWKRCSHKCEKGTLKINGVSNYI